MTMKKVLSISLSMLLVLSTLTGCGNGGQSASQLTPAAPAAQTSTAADSGTAGGPETQPEVKSTMKVAYLTENLGDNANNDDAYSGVKRFAEDHSIEVTVIETKELQDYDINARNLASEGYDLIMVSTPTASELIGVLAPDYPDTHFIISEGTVRDLENVSCWESRPAEAAFLTGAFNVLMNQELGGPAKAAFVGGVRNPGLERAQFSFKAGAEYVGGECTVVYVGNFTDVAKGKEIAIQLYQSDLKLIQAYAGGAGMGVYQAAESMPEDYYALGAANGQFHLSDRILASQVKKGGDTWYNCMQMYQDGTLPSGAFSLGIKEGVVDIVYAPGKEDMIPEEIKTQISALRDQIISGEIVPPNTEAEYNAFQK